MLCDTKMWKPTRLKMRGNRLTLDPSNRPGRHDAGRNEAWKGGMGTAKQSGAGEDSVFEAGADAAQGRKEFRHPVDQKRVG